MEELAGPPAYAVHETESVLHGGCEDDFGGAKGAFACSPYMLHIGCLSFSSKSSLRPSHLKAVDTIRARSLSAWESIAWWWKKRLRFYGSRRSCFSLDIFLLFASGLASGLDETACFAPFLFSFYARTIYNRWHT